MTHWKPQGRSTVSAFVVVRDADKALKFVQDVFGARVVRAPLRRINGALWNAEVTLGGSTILFGEAESDDMHRPAFLYVMVEDADAVYAKALDHGGQTMMPTADQFYGARDGGVMDPCGNWWWIATHKEDVSDDELARRARDLEAKKGA